MESEMMYLWGFVIVLAILVILQVIWLNRLIRHNNKAHDDISREIDKVAGATKFVLLGGGWSGLGVVHTPLARVVRMILSHLELSVNNIQEDIELVSTKPAKKKASPKKPAKKKA